MDSNTKLIAVHCSGYAVAAQTLNIPLRKPKLDRGLRLSYGDVIDTEALAPEPEMLERAAAVMLCGCASIRRFDPGVSGDRDAPASLDLLYVAALIRYGSSADRAHGAERICA